MRHDEPKSDPTTGTNVSWNTTEHPQSLTVIHLRLHSLFKSRQPYRDERNLSTDPVYYRWLVQTRFLAQTLKHQEHRVRHTQQHSDVLGHDIVYEGTATLSPALFRQMQELTIWLRPFSPFELALDLPLRTRLREQVIPTEIQLEELKSFPAYLELSLFFGSNRQLCHCSDSSSGVASTIVRPRRGPTLPMSKRLSQQRGRRKGLQNGASSVIPAKRRSTWQTYGSDLGTSTSSQDTEECIRESANYTSTPRFIMSCLFLFKSWSLHPLVLVGCLDSLPRQLVLLFLTDRLLVEYDVLQR